MHTAQLRRSKEIQGDSRHPSLKSDQIIECAKFQLELHVIVLSQLVKDHAEMDYTLNYFCPKWKY